MQINSKTSPLISVIMNCYNGETYLVDAVKSVLNQSYKNFEIIFWDNKSKDKSANIFKSFQDKRLKYFLAKQHTSLYEARNLAIQKSKGQFIAFLDTDDLWTKNKLSLQIKKFKNKNIGLVFSNYWNLNQLTGLKSLAYKKELPEGVIYQKLLKNYFLAIGTVILRKSIFQKNKKNFDKDFNIIGDFDFFMRISKNTHFAAVQDPLLVYRIHKKSFSSNNYQMYINEFKLWIKKRGKFNENLFFVKQKIMYMQTILYILNENFFFAFKNILKINSKKKQIKLIFLLFTPNFIFKKLKRHFFS
jgi:glycosyltransferase involved in cell wall biosynthesis